MWFFDFAIDPGALNLYDDDKNAELNAGTKQYIKMKIARNEFTSQRPKERVRWGKPPHSSHKARFVGFAVPWNQQTRQPCEDLKEPWEEPWVSHWSRS